MWIAIAIIYKFNYVNCDLRLWIAIAIIYVNCDYLQIKALFVETSTILLLLPKI